MWRLLCFATNSAKPHKYSVYNDIKLRKTANPHIYDLLFGIWLQDLELPLFQYNVFVMSIPLSARLWRQNVCYFG